MKMIRLLIVDVPAVLGTLLIFFGIQNASTAIGQWLIIFGVMFLLLAGAVCALHRYIPNDYEGE
jgi:hypothetical protein